MILCYGHKLDDLIHDLNTNKVIFVKVMKKFLFLNELFLKIYNQIREEIRERSADHLRLKKRQVKNSIILEVSNKKILIRIKM